MAIDTIIAPEIKIKIQGEERKVEFKLKNFAVLQRVHGISEGALIKGLIQGEVAMIPYAIWASTLKFAPFTPEEPLKIESQADIEQLFNLSLIELKEITDKVIQALEAYLPKRPGTSSGGTPAPAPHDHKAPAKKKTVNKKKTQKK